MCKLYAFVYVSKASHPLTKAELRHLLDRARARNAQEHVTGVLLYAHGNFMQYLEGPSEGIACVYEHIKADPNHGCIIELLHEPVPEREFADWAMALRSVSAFGMSSPEEFDQQFIPKIDPAVASHTGVHRMLWKFWNKGMA